MVVRVSYQGEPGAYSEKAGRTLLGSLVSDWSNFETVGYHSFEETFQAVEEGEVSFGILPIENSLGGSIHTNYDLLLKYNLFIVAELDFRVRHCLLVNRGVKKQDIKKVISHPQALAQCQNYIEKQLGSVPEAQYDTAGSAKLLELNQWKDTAAIASDLAAKYYHLDILDEGIEDEDTNYTRFLLLSKTPEKISLHHEMKTSIVCSYGPNNHQGQLYKILGAFASRDIDLTKIETRPAKKNLRFPSSCPPRETTITTLSCPPPETTLSCPPRETSSCVRESGSLACRSKYAYLFYIDFIGHVQDIRVMSALNSIREFCPLVRVFGTYPTNGYLLDHVKNQFQIHSTLVSSSEEVEEVEEVEVEVTEKENLLLLGLQKNTKKSLRIGVIGFGNFGQFLAQKLCCYNHQVFATSRTDYSYQANSMGCEFIPWCDLDALFLKKLDVLILAVSIVSFENLVAHLPFHLMENLLLVDVLSVKVHPKQILLKYAPSTCDILCCHPMFGPESGKHSWKQLPFMYEKVRISSQQQQKEALVPMDDNNNKDSDNNNNKDSDNNNNNAADAHFLDREERCNEFLNVFVQENCKMISMSCEKHDEDAAKSQFLTHLTGRILGKQELKPTLIDTKGFKSVLELVDNTCKDSFDLFYGLYKFNTNSAQHIHRFRESLEFVQRQLQLQETTLKNNIISPLVRNLTPSKTIVIHALTKKMENNGIPVVSLCVGEPDFSPHSTILQSTKNAVDQGHTFYTGVSGTLELRQQICNYLLKHKHIAYQPNEILVSNGGKQAIYQAILALCQPGDQVIIPSPFWVSYPEIVRLAGATPVLLQTTHHNGFLIDPLQLDQLITTNTKLLILCNPSNPTGALHSLEDLEKLAQVLRHPKNQHVYVLADEIYERLVYDTPHVSFASLKDMWSRTLTINGFSKAYAMTGYRLGYLAAPLEIVQAATTLQGQITSCANSLSQKAAITALELPQSYMDAIVLEMKTKRDLVAQHLLQIPHFQFQVNKGAFYLFPKVNAYFGKKTQDGTLIQTCEDFCLQLLEKYYTAIVPGSAFGDPDAIRIAYSTDIPTLNKAMDNLKNFCASLH